MNPKIIALVQAVFYGCITITVPIVVAALGAGGALSGIFTPTVTGIILFVLNLVDNNLNAKTGGNFFGSLH